MICGESTKHSQTIPWHLIYLNWNWIRNCHYTEGSVQMQKAELTQMRKTKRIDRIRASCRRISYSNSHCVQCSSHSICLKPHQRHMSRMNRHRKISHSDRMTYTSLHIVWTEHAIGRDTFFCCWRNWMEEALLRCSSIGTSTYNKIHSWHYYVCVSYRYLFPKTLNIINNSIAFIWQYL